MFRLLGVLCLLLPAPTLAWDNDPAFTHHFIEPDKTLGGEPMQSLKECRVKLITSTGQMTERVFPAKVPTGGLTKGWTWLATLKATPKGCGVAKIYCINSVGEGAPALQGFVFEGCVTEPETTPPPPPTDPNVPAEPEPEPEPPPPPPTPPGDPCSQCPCPEPVVCPEPPLPCPAKTGRELDMEQKVKELYDWTRE